MMEVVIGFATLALTALTGVLAGGWSIGATLNKKFDSTDERLGNLEHSIDLLKKQSEFDKTLFEQRIIASLDRTNETVTDIQIQVKALHTRLDQVTHYTIEHKTL